MTVSDATWSKWLNILEDLLHEADTHRETMLAIHLNSAVETAYERSGKKRPKPDFIQQFKTLRDC